MTEPWWYRIQPMPGALRADFPPAWTVYYARIG